MLAASHGETSSQRILPELIVVFSTFGAPSFSLARFLPHTSKLQDLTDAPLGLHWPADLMYWIDTSQQPTDSYTCQTDTCKSWALLQKLLSLQPFQRKYLFKYLKVFPFEETPWRGQEGLEDLSK